MTAFYNEPDTYAAAWLENLIAAGHIAPGIVDRRPIQEIEAWELAEFTQCHFFAGIGIWSHALRRAGWSDDRPIWTGSCPCQPFSAAGQRKGISDERHLWPYWHQLIDQCRPAIVVGEQVASKDGLGWLDLVSTDLERADYAFGASDLCAAGFGQAHIRQRLYFVGLAHTLRSGQSGSGWVQRSSNSAADADREKHRTFDVGRERDLANLGMADPGNEPREWLTGKVPGSQAGEHGEGRAVDGGFRVRHSDGGEVGRMVQPYGAGSFEGQQGTETTRYRDTVVSTGGVGELQNIRDPGQIASRWLDVDWLLCRNPDGEPNWRPVEAGTFPLDNGITNRMGKLRAFGNGLDAETATNFCEVVREIADDLRPLMREYDL